MKTTTKLILSLACMLLVQPVIQAMDTAQSLLTDENSKQTSVSISRAQTPLEHLANDQTLYLSKLPPELQRIIFLLSDPTFLQEAEQLFHYLQSRNAAIASLENIHKIEQHLLGMLKECIEINGSQKGFLAEALNHQFLHTIRTLIKTCNVNRTCKNSTLLEIAVLGGPENVATILSQYPALNVNLQNDHSWSSFHTAVWQGDVKTITSLLSAGADVNQLTALGFSPLVMAALKNDWAMIRALLSDKNIDVLTPVLFALGNQQPHVATTITTAYLLLLFNNEVRVTNFRNLLLVMLSVLYVRNNL